MLRLERFIAYKKLGGEVFTSVLVHSVGKINHNSLFDQLSDALDESLVCRVGLDIVIPILCRCELGDKTMGDSILVLLVNQPARINKNKGYQSPYLEALGRIVLSSLKGRNIDGLCGWVNTLLL